MLMAAIFIHGSYQHCDNLVMILVKGCIQEAVISATGVVSLCKEHPFRQGEIEYPISTLSLHLISDEEPKSSRLTNSDRKFEMDKIRQKPPGPLIMMIIF